MVNLCKCDLPAVTLTVLVVSRIQRFQLIFLNGLCGTFFVDSCHYFFVSFLLRFTGFCLFASKQRGTMSNVGEHRKHWNWEKRAKSRKKKAASKWAEPTLTICLNEESNSFSFLNECHISWIKTMNAMLNAISRSGHIAYNSKAKPTKITKRQRNQVYTKRWHSGCCEMCRFIARIYDCNCTQSLLLVFHFDFFAWRLLQFSR